MEYLVLFFASSFRIRRVQRMCCRDALCATYSVPHVLRAIVSCVLDAHDFGAPNDSSICPYIDFPYALSA